ncbi:hypothetical protein Aduo_006093 [Ancylostoma duodenale]
MLTVVLILSIVIACRCKDPCEHNGKIYKHGEKWIKGGFVKQCEESTKYGLERRAEAVACLTKYYQEIPVDQQLTVRGIEYSCIRDEDGVVRLKQSITLDKKDDE